MSGLIATTGNALSALGGIGGVVSDILDGSWLSQLLPATWRGIPFFIRATELSAGRRTAIHTYPFRDDQWPEDIGRAERIYDFSAFILGDRCHAQARAIIAASETPGPGTLNHPWLGAKTVSLAEPVRMAEHAELGRVIEVRFRFIEYSRPVYPSAVLDTAAASILAGAASFAATIGSFAARVAGAVTFGATVLEAGEAVVQRFCDAAAQLAGDPGLVTGAVAGLPPPAGTFFGRYANGARGALLPGITTAPAAIAAVAQGRAAVLAAGTAAIAAASLAGTAANPLPAAVLAVTEAVRACCADPADATRATLALAAYAVTVDPGTGPTSRAIAALQAAVASLCRQAALTSLAYACASARLASAADFLALRTAAVALYDAEIQAAADGGFGTEYTALRGLRAAVIADLNARGAQLPGLVEITTRVPEPALALAYRLYGDASRADELTARSGAVASLFLPTAFEGLAA